MENLKDGRASHKRALKKVRSAIECLSDEFLHSRGAEEDREILAALAVLFKKNEQLHEASGSAAESEPGSAIASQLAQPNLTQPKTGSCIPFPVRVGTSRPGRSGGQM